MALFVFIESIDDAVEYCGGTDMLDVVTIGILLMRDAGAPPVAAVVVFGVAVVLGAAVVIAVVVVVVVECGFDG